MDAKQFRECATATIDLLVDYFENISQNRNVLPDVEPGYLMKMLPENAPEEPQDWKTVLKDFSETVMPGVSTYICIGQVQVDGAPRARELRGAPPSGWVKKGQESHDGVTLWHSPQFHAYYPTGSSYASIIGSLLSDGLGIVGFTWMASPACTELEVVTMNWLGKLIGLPEEFLNCSSGPGGGIIQGSASEATLVALLAAKDKMFRKLKESDPDLDEDVTKAKFVAYTSDQCNSSVEKAGVLGSMKMRLLKSDQNAKLRGETLRRAFEEDIAQGLIPCYVVANLGTTGTCAFDPLYELGPVCQDHNVWLHVDAAYAGVAFICPEYRHLMKGVEYAESFDINVHKWLLTNFDCSAMWVRDGYDLINAFDVQRIYLDDVNSTVKVPDLRHWQMPLGRRFRSLKVWTVLKMYGAEGLRSHIRNQISLAQYFAKLVRMDERFIVEPEPSMGLACFRLQNGDKITKELLKNLTEKKEIFMVGCTYRNRYVIRFVICSRFTKKEDIETSWNIIKLEADRICPLQINAKAPSITAIDHLETVTISEKSK